MKFLTPFFVFLAFSLALYAGPPAIDREKIILEGLSQKLLKERIKYVEMAPTTDSRPVFEKLMQMYKVDNEIKPAVFEAMQKMNTNSGGVFSELLTVSIKDEFEKLKLLNGSNKPHIFYLEVVLSYFLEKPFPGYDAFVESIIQCADTMLADANTEREDPVKLRAEILGHCILYLAKRGKPGFMKKLEAVYLNDDIWEQGKIISVFIENKDPAIFRPLSERIIKQPLDDIPDGLLRYFQEYAEAIGKPIPPEIMEKMKQYTEKGLLEAEEILKDY